MNKESSNPNIEWKKTGFDNQERVTLKVNVKEAALYNAKKKNPQTASVPNPVNLPKGLKKIRKKIRDVFDDEEDEDENEFQITPSGLELESGNSLLNALNEDEKKILHQQENLQNMKLQQTAGKMEAIATVTQLAKQAGIKGMEKDIASKNLQNVAPTDEIFAHTIRDILAEKENVKGEDIPAGKVIQTLRGVKRVKEMGGNKALQGLKLQDIQEIGEKNLKPNDKESKEYKEVAKLILKKSGQDIKKKKAKPSKNASAKNKLKAKNNALTQKRNLSLRNLNDRT